MVAVCSKSDCAVLVTVCAQHSVCTCCCAALQLVAIHTCAALSLTGWVQAEQQRVCSIRMQRVAYARAAEQLSWIQCSRMAELEPVREQMNVVRALPAASTFGPYHTALVEVIAQHVCGKCSCTLWWNIATA